MASYLERLFTRAATPKAGLGNLLVQPKTTGGGKGPKVATQNISWQSPGQPQILDQDAQQLGEDAYLGQVYVMRCCQAIAQTISGLPFRAGMDPTDPAAHDLTAPLVQLLGEATPQAPGGPNPKTASRAFWAWSIVQYLVYGRWAWEAQLAGPKNNGLVVGLWPLIAPHVSPIPTQGGEEYFESFVYTTPQAGDLKMSRDQMIYAWRPSLLDWRLPETVLSAAKLPIYIARGLDRYMVKLLQNDMVASTLVVTPPFDEPSARRAWQEQFLTSFSGADNRGKTIFAEAEYDEDDTSGKPLVQVEKIAQTAVDAQLLELSKTAKDEICVAFGVPLSLIGNAQERIYANASSEYKNFWTMTVMNLITEIQDHVNTLLAPRLGQEVGWFDLSRVAALQPPQIFAPPMISDIINYGIASAAQIANVLGIPAADATEDSDTDTVELGEESAGIGPSGINRTSQIYMHTRAGFYPSWEGKGAYKPTRERDERNARAWKGTIVTREQLINARIRYERRPINSHNWDEPFRASNYLQREHIRAITIADEIVEELQIIERAVGLVENTEAESILRDVEHLRDRARAVELERRARETQDLIDHTVGISEGVRMIAVQDRIRRNVKAKLAQHYPNSTLGWTDDADWDGPKQINLEDVEMGRRPGARDPKKTSGIMKAMASGQQGALEPVVLVQTPTKEKLQVADGYHRLKARQKLGHVAINAYVAKVDSDEGPWDSEMHDKKQNRSSGVWHNSDGPSPDALPEEMAGHLHDEHNMPELASNWRDFTPHELDDIHSRDHSEYGETGAHERRRSVSQDNAAYQEGKSDKKGGKPKLTSEEFADIHAKADADDYPLYQAGYEADRDDLDLKLEPRNAWLPNQDLNCAECGKPATGYSEDGDGKKTGYCSSHFDVSTSADSVRRMEIQGIPLREWLKANEVGLMALAEAEEEDEPEEKTA